MEAKKRRAYKPRSLSGAERYVRCLHSQLEDYERYSKAMRRELLILAKLSAKGPCFFNPLDAWEAESIRDKILRQVGLTPDGTPVPPAPTQESKL